MPVRYPGSRAHRKLSKKISLGPDTIFGAGFSILSISLAALLSSGALPAPPAVARESALDIQAANALTAKRFDYTIELTTQAVKQNPNDAQAYLLRASAKSETDNLTGAIADFEKSTKLAPCTNCVIYRQIAGCYFGLQKYDQALSALDASIKIKPTSEAFRIKGQILWKLKRSSESLAAFDRALNIDPKDYWIHEDRCNCYSKLGRFSEALADVNKLIEMRPKEARNFALRAEIYDKLGKKDLAATDRKKASLLSPQEWF